MAHLHASELTLCGAPGAATGLQRPGPRRAPDVPLVDAVRDGADKGRHVRDRQPLAPREGD